MDKDRDVKRDKYGWLPLERVFSQPKLVAVEDVAEAEEILAEFRDEMLERAPACVCVLMKTGEFGA